MSEAVLDASAVLTLLLGEPGADKVQATLPGALISAVNLAEVISKLCERGMPSDQAALAIDSIGVEIVAFDGEQARLSGELRPLTRILGLSLGDRACLALARLRNLPAITADVAWAGVPDCRVILIRGGELE
ncbi:PIN domain protein [mine drainage metagenome]|uniref:PIN domain protein n=1 Tax=mine drainage metagenome TaxID=410659 RepID=A0A1J5S367_9ZZZZ